MRDDSDESDDHAAENVEREARTEILRTRKNRWAPARAERGMGFYASAPQHQRLRLPAAVAVGVLRGQLRRRVPTTATALATATAAITTDNLLGATISV